MRSGVVLALLVALAARAQAHPLPGGGPNPLLYLHPLVNYGTDPDWTRAWERSLQSANSLRVNVGSVSTDEFLTDIELHVSEPISSVFRVLYDMRWFEALHVEPRDAEHFLGFGLAALPVLDVQLQVHPASRKEEIDLRVGLLLHDKSCEQYARFFLRWDDPLFDEKNGIGAVGEQTATSVQWVARGTLGPLEAFSRGLYGSANRRSYPDSTRIPDLISDSEQTGASETRVRLLDPGGSFVELEFAHHEFESSATPRATGVTGHYSNSLFDLALRGVWISGEAWRLRGEIHRLGQHAESTSFDYSRKEWMPALWLRRSLNQVHDIEVGYMGTSYRWSGSPESPQSEDGYRQKLELAWLIEPSESARLQFSVSHEPDPQRFGGANVQVQVVF